MLSFRSKQIVVIATVIILSGLFVLTGCQNDGQTIPVYEPVASPPVEATIDQLLSDYISDDEAADAKYKDKRLLFTDVEVEEVKVNLIEDYDIPIIHIVSNGIEFKPKYNMDTSSIREGFVVDIIGEVYGWFGVSDQYLVIDNCWFKIIESDSGAVLDLEDLY
jgi:hypothetical protein